MRSAALRIVASRSAGAELFPRRQEYVPLEGEEEEEPADEEGGEREVKKRPKDPSPAASAPVGDAASPSDKRFFATCFRL